MTKKEWAAKPALKEKNNYNPRVFNPEIISLQEHYETMKSKWRT